MLGTDISAPEVTHISKNGFWLLLDNEEFLLDFKNFPWFRHATIDELSHVELPAPAHWYWPDLDIDLAVESVRHPEFFPLIAKGHN